eukprot:CAMPEP_0184723970 /NCGR_PEP_ID=MMETSP0314-20130426/26645_1 /TAXON_ID=38298 /ORGANISM="Rhodella maculata, Strain CCMP 736" /LENGTH=228 /DNA_ID=CAMNT_0027188873 /DNA_START=19 /DNA_END=705 /DNA_ORIENTATION=+
MPTPDSATTPRAPLAAPLSHLAFAASPPASPASPVVLAHSPARHPLRLNHRRLKSFRPSATRQSRRATASPVTALVPPPADAPPAGAASMLVLAATGAAVAYWWLVLVPDRRRALARRKRGGDVGEMLDELEASTGNENRAERWFYADWLAKRREVRARGGKGRVEGRAEGDQNTRAESGTVPAARRADKDSEGDDREPSFWSLDNPLVASFVLLAVLVLGSSLLFQR